MLQDFYITLTWMITINLNQCAVHSFIFIWMWGEMGSNALGIKIGLSVSIIPKLGPTQSREFGKPHMYRAGKVLQVYRVN